MASQILTRLQDWDSLDTWMCVVAALAAMSCTLPGIWLMLRRQSLMGDALSHTALPGIVVSFLAMNALEHQGWLTRQQVGDWIGLVMVLGAVLVGLLTAFLSEWVSGFARVESGTALGVVFTTLFAAGLWLLRFAADTVHLDADCVLFGQLETAVLETWGHTDIPHAAVLNGSLLVINLVLMFLFFKELRLCAFDPALATTLGIPARPFHYGLMAVTAATVVAAFRSVGSILVVGLLIVPAATAFLLTRRLWLLIVLALLIALASPVLGHVAAVTLPGILFSKLGWPQVSAAGTAGMTAVAGGCLFLLAWLFSPTQGLITRALSRLRSALRMAGEDLLGILYRQSETNLPAETAADLASRHWGLGPISRALAILRLRSRGEITRASGKIQLTERGRSRGASLIRGHRLWEAYMATHFELPPDHYHAMAESVEHVLDSTIQDELASELKTPRQDPHGREIPSTPPTSE